MPHLQVSGGWSCSCGADIKDGPSPSLSHAWTRFVGRKPVLPAPKCPGVSGTEVAVTSFPRLKGPTTLAPKCTTLCSKPGLSSVLSLKVLRSQLGGHSEHLDEACLAFLQPRPDPEPPQPFPGSLYQNPPRIWQEIKILGSFPLSQALEFPECGSPCRWRTARGSQCTAMPGPQSPLIEAPHGQHPVPAVRMPGLPPASRLDTPPKHPVTSCAPPCGHWHLAFFPRGMTSHTATTVCLHQKTPSSGCCQNCQDGPVPTCRQRAPIPLSYMSPSPTGTHRHCMQIHTHTGTYRCTHADDTLTQRHAHRYTHTHTHAYEHTQMHTQAHADTYTIQAILFPPAQHLTQIPGPSRTMFSGR